MSAPVRELDDDGLSKDGPLNYAPKRVRRSGQVPIGVPRKADVAPRFAAPGAPEPPWGRKKQRQAFAGDVAMTELRTRLALTPDRLPDPPLPVATVSKSYPARRMVSAIVVAIVGFAAYRWAVAPPPARSQGQFTLSSNQLSNQEDSAPERSLRSVSPAHLKTPSPDPQLPQVQPAASSLAPRIVEQVRGVTDGATSANAQRVAATSAPLTLTQPASAKSVTSKASLPAADEQKSRDNTAVDRSGVRLESSGSSSFAPARSQPRRHEAVEIALMVRNGTEFMANGNIGAARMMFQPAAEAGDPMAAFALAETYDPMVLRKLGAKGGITPDVALAHSWYEKAKDLGSPVAPERLERLARLTE
ncbi:MAG TPA: hypothetical protein VLJ17_07740 [Xanthobacteraceae bacterium]|nr:hypothetical protein [Xanthobacteraceae bacterium]